MKVFCRFLLQMFLFTISRYMCTSSDMFDFFYFSSLRGCSTGSLPTYIMISYKLNSLCLFKKETTMMALVGMLKAEGFTRHKFVGNCGGSLSISKA